MGASKLGWQLKTSIRLILTIFLALILTACGSLAITRVTPQQRMFLDLSLDFLGAYQLPTATFKETTVGGLSALTYDPQSGNLYALSDDRSKKSPARFYTLNLLFNQQKTGEVVWDRAEIEDVTFLKDEQGKTYGKGSIDPEGIALTPQGTLFISSEGNIDKGIAPFIGEFELETGQQRQYLPIPSRYLPNSTDESPESPRGIQDNLGFESLTIKASSMSTSDPLRLFTATESALFQDNLPADSSEQVRIRLLHYLIQPIAAPILVAEHLYLLASPPDDAIVYGLTELMALEPEGFFLSLERSYGLSGFGAKIFQVATGDASDTSRTESLQGDLAKIRPLRKRLLLDLADLGIELDNLEGMTFGPRLPDGTQSLILVSDNNFQDEQVTQLLLFRLTSK